MSTNRIPNTPKRIAFLLAITLALPNPAVASPELSRRTLRQLESAEDERRMAGLEDSLLGAKYLDGPYPDQETLGALKEHLTSQDLKKESLFIEAMGGLRVLLPQMGQLGQLGQVTKDQWQQHLEAVLGIWVNSAKAEYERYLQSMSAWTETYGRERFARSPYTTAGAQDLKRDWERREAEADQLREVLPTAPTLLVSAYKTLQKARDDDTQQILTFSPTGELKQKVVDQHLIAFEDATGIYVLQGFMEFVQREEQDKDQQISLIAALLGHAGVERALLELQADRDVSHALAEALERMLLNAPLPSPENVPPDSRLDELVREFIAEFSKPPEVITPADVVQPVPQPLPAPAVPPVQPPAPPKGLSAKELSARYGSRAGNVQGWIDTASGLKPKLQFADGEDPSPAEIVQKLLVLRDAGVGLDGKKIHIGMQSLLDLLEKIGSFALFEQIVTQVIKGIDLDKAEVKPAKNFSPEEAYNARINRVTNDKDKGGISLERVEEIVKFLIRSRQAEAARTKAPPAQPPAQPPKSPAPPVSPPQPSTFRSYGTDDLIKVYRGLVPVEKLFRADGSLSDEGLPMFVTLAQELSPIAGRMLVTQGVNDRIKQLREAKGPGSEYLPTMPPRVEDRKAVKLLEKWKADYNRGKTAGEAITTSVEDLFAAQQVYGKPGLENPASDALIRILRHVGILPEGEPAARKTPVKPLPAPAVPPAQHPLEIVLVPVQGFAPVSGEEGLYPFLESTLSKFVFQAYVRLLNEAEGIPPTMRALSNWMEADQGFMNSVPDKSTRTVLVEQTVGYIQGMAKKQNQPPFLILPEGATDEVKRLVAVFLAVDIIPQQGGAEEKVQVPAGMTDLARIKGILSSNEGVLHQLSRQDPRFSQYIERLTNAVTATVAPPVQIVPPVTIRKVLVDRFLPQVPSSKDFRDALALKDDPTLLALYDAYIAFLDGHRQVPVAKELIWPTVYSLKKMQGKRFVHLPQRELDFILEPLKMVAQEARERGVFWIVLSVAPRPDAVELVNAYASARLRGTVILSEGNWIPLSKALMDRTLPQLKQIVANDAGLLAALALEDPQFGDIIRLIRTASKMEESPAAPVETPVVETPVVETPVVETPVVETPVVETPVVEAPVVEAPVVEAPVVEAPVVEAPVVETPVVETPVVETPVVETPVVEAPVVETPVVETPVVETPVVETPVVETPVVETPVVETPVVEAPLPASVVGAQLEFPEIPSILAEGFDNVWADSRTLFAVELLVPSPADWSAFREMMEKEFLDALAGLKLSPADEAAKKKAFYDFEEKMLSDLLQAARAALTLDLWKQTTMGVVEAEFQRIAAEQVKLGARGSDQERKGQDRQKLYAEISQELFQRAIQKHFDILVSGERSYGELLPKLQGFFTRSLQPHGFALRDFNKAVADLGLSERFTQLTGKKAEAVSSVGETTESNPYRAMYGIITKQDKDIKLALVPLLGSDVDSGAKTLARMFVGQGDGIFWQWLPDLPKLETLNRDGANVLSRIKSARDSILVNKGFRKKPGAPAQHDSTQFLRTQELPARLAYAILMTLELHRYFRSQFTTGHEDDLALLGLAGKRLTAPPVSPGRPLPGTPTQKDAQLVQAIDDLNLGIQPTEAAKFEQGVWRIQWKLFPKSKGDVQTALDGFVRQNGDTTLIRRRAGEIKGLLMHGNEKSLRLAITAWVKARVPGYVDNSASPGGSKAGLEESVEAQLIRTLPGLPEGVLRVVSVLSGPGSSREARVSSQPMRIFDRVGQIRDSGLLWALRVRNIRYIPLSDSEAQAAELLQGIAPQDLVIVNPQTTDAEIAAWLPAGASPMVVRVSKDHMEKLVAEGLPAIEMILRLADQAREKGARSLEILSLDIEMFQGYRMAVVTAA